MATDAAQHSPLLSVNEAADYLRLKPSTLRTWRSTGAVDVPCVKVGGRVYYTRPALDAFLESCANPPGSMRMRRS